MLSAESVTCDHCSGSGWVPVEGSLQARPCRCQIRERQQRRVTAAGIPKRYIHCTLEGFHARGNSSLAAARKRVTEFVDCWPAIDRGLLLTGPCGVGKTHLAVAALQEIIASGKPGSVVFSNFQDLIHQIQASFSSDQVPTKTEILQPLLDADLLVLDELGSQKPTAFVQDILYYLINTRYNDEKVTFFTTNYHDEPRRESEERLDQRIGERLRSRLYEMTEKVVLDSEDYRKTVARSRV